MLWKWLSNTQLNTYRCHYSKEYLNRTPRETGGAFVECIFMYFAWWSRCGSYIQLEANHTQLFHQLIIYICLHYLPWCNAAWLTHQRHSWRTRYHEHLVWWPRFDRSLVLQQLSVYFLVTQWRHQTGTLSALLDLCAGNSPVTEWPVTRNFDVSFDLRLNKWSIKQSLGWWFETPSRSLWRQCNDITLDRKCSFRFLC